MPEAKTGDKEQAQGKRKDNALMQWTRFMRSKRKSLEDKLLHVSDDITPLVNAFFESAHMSSGEELTPIEKDYIESNYYKAFEVIAHMDSAFDDIPYCTPDDPTGENHENVFTDAIVIQELFVLYYFTTRPDLKPSGHDLGEMLKDADNIRETYKRFDEFLAQRFKDRFIHDGLFTEDFEYHDHNDDDLLEDIAAFIKQENPADAQEIIELMSTATIDRQAIPNNKLANTITRGIIDIGQIVIDVAGKQEKKKQKTIETTCILTDESNNVKLSGRQKFTDYDRSVYNAVSSLYKFGDANHIVTSAMIFRSMNGLTGSEKPTAGQLSAVTKSVDKMRFIRVQIDCTAEWKARGITLNSKQIDEGIADTYLLMAKSIKVKAGGQIVTAYRLMDTPILLEYSEAVNQVLTIPADVLAIKKLSITTDPDGITHTQTKGLLSNTDQRIVLKGYLIRRIEGMKGNNSLHNKSIALYDYDKNGEHHEGLYSKANIPDADGTIKELSRMEMKRIRDDVETMLEYWKHTQYIKDYKPVTRQTKIISYEIIV